MQSNATQKSKLSERISEMISSDTPLRDLASNFSVKAREALEEANNLTVEEIKISLKRLPKNLDGFKIIHLSDIHHSPFTDIEHIERTVEITNSLDPDLCILTGDFVSHEPEYIEPMAEVLGRISAKHGSFACLGNHDHWTDAELVTKSLENNKIKVLINEGFRFQANDASFWLAGVDDYMVGKTDLQSSLKGSFPDEMKMLLAHNPVIFSTAARLGVDVVFSGHTHGGQVKIRSKKERKNRIFQKRRLTGGLHSRKNSQIYITRGIGTVVLPIRYGCPPEISDIRLSAE